MFVSEKTHKYNNFHFETGSELISQTGKYAMLWYSARRIICVYVMFHSFNTLFSWIIVLNSDLKLRVICSGLNLWKSGLLRDDKNHKTCTVYSTSNVKCIIHLTLNGYQTVTIFLSSVRHAYLPCGCGVNTAKCFPLECAVFSIILNSLELSKRPNHCMILLSAKGTFYTITQESIGS